VTAKGADLALVGDPFGDCDEVVCDNNSKTGSLDGDICNDIVDHLVMRGGDWVLSKFGRLMRHK